MKNTKQQWKQTHQVKFQPVELYLAKEVMLPGILKANGNIKKKQNNELGLKYVTWSTF